MTDNEIRQLLRSRLDDVEARIRRACDRVGRDHSEVLVVPTTKTVSVRVAQLLTELGIRDLAESRPQELWKKADAVKADGLRWHLIGHLQRNKVERTLPLVAVVHSVDSLRLAEAIDALQPTTVLLEVNASREAEKHGFAPEAMPPFREWKNLRIAGLMTMAAYADDPEASRPAFAEVRRLRDRLRQEWGLPLGELSMGMSNDFEVAIEEGATMVRLGTTLFDGLGGE